MSELLDTEEIKKIIPHRYPFLFVDRITEIKAGESIKGYKNISYNEEIFMGHFPQKPIFPGVLIIEAMAQLGAFLIMSQLPEERRMAYFAGIDKARFRRLVVPGDRLDLEVIILKYRGGFAVLEGTATVNGEIAAQATIMSAMAK